MKFYLTSIGKECFILGYPFLRAFNPAVNWQTSNLGGKVQIKTLSFRRAQNKVRALQWKAIREKGRLKTGQAIFIRKVTKSQQWAQEVHSRISGKTEVKFLDMYKRYKDIFDEKKAE